MMVRLEIEGEKGRKRYLGSGMPIKRSDDFSDGVSRRNLMGKILNLGQFFEQFVVGNKEEDRVSICRLRSHVISAMLDPFLLFLPHAHHTHEGFLLFFFYALTFVLEG